MIQLLDARAFYLGTASALALAFSSPADAQTAPATSGAPQAAADTRDIIVTAQRRSESVQNVPIAVSVFTQKSLELQRMDGGPELVRAVPNIAFAKGYFAGFNFQIRGVGTQLGTASADAGVGIHMNNVPLTTSRFFEAEFYDTDRVEVLRGPQGTLYGRNATGGVVNVVTNKPTNDFAGSISGEVATYNSFKAKGFVNVPLVNDVLALRLAGSYLRRSGFGVNTETGENVNGRKLWSTRASVVFKPAPGVEAYGMWQHFYENDDRTRTGGLICVTDPGPTSVGGVAVTNPVIRGSLSQGCKDASIYSAGRNGTPNSLATIFGSLTQAFGYTSGNYFAGKTVSRNLQDTDSLQSPKYRARSDLFQFNLGIQLSPALKFTSISSYTNDNVFSSRDFQSAVPSIGFNATPLTPGGRFTDPQLGTFDRLTSVDYFKSPSKQWSQELRLDSSFKGPFNFSVGGIYVHYKTLSDYFIFANVFTLATTTFNGGAPCAINTPTCFYIDPSQVPDKSGHNYFLSSSPYNLRSKALFGEAYFQLSDQLKLTIGARYTDDKKSQVNLPVRLLTPGSGAPPGAIPNIAIEFKEPTGRIAIDYKPHLGFTDSTLLYAVASRGYKAGGLNPPPSFTPLPPYRPEFINSFEVGTKNTLMNHRLTLNLTAFHYDYKDYQVAEIRDRTQQIQNIDAKVKGLEFETMFEPVDRLRFNAALGLLDTKITRGSFVNPTNFTGGDPNLTLVKAFAGGVCAVNTAALAAFLATNPPAAVMNGVCAGAFAGAGLVPNTTGIATNLKGNDLPNAPHWTLSVGAQYTAPLGGDWLATLRGDYYVQGNSFARTYNSVGDRLNGWSNVNATLTVGSHRLGLEGQLFVKNLFNKQPILNTFLADTITGLIRSGFVAEPRIIGVNLTKSF